MRLTRQSRFASWFACAGALTALGCGAEFDRPSEIHSLRVFGVEKSSPYAQPGETVHLSLSFYDGSPEAVPPEMLVDGEDSPRKVQIAWLGGCFNPAGDLYAGCFGASPDSLTLAIGPEFAITMPDDVMVPRPPPMLPYGLSYVFFAVCAGELSIDTSGALGLPLRCQKGPGGPSLGSNDFVAGYTAIYVFGKDGAGEPYLNLNPVIEGFSVAGKELTELGPEAGGNFCLGGDCLADCSDPMHGCVNAPPAAIDCSTGDAACVAACKDDGDFEKCDGIAIRPLIDQSLPAEVDAVSRDVYDRPYQEQMWINYYATRGAMKSDARLLNDATKGWNADYGTEFFAPSTPGPVRVWAVVHDNRGGSTWIGATLQVQ